MNETSFGRVNRNRARGSLCESESSHGDESTIAESRCQAGSFGLWITCGQLGRVYLSTTFVNIDKYGALIVFFNR
jgi:hypothetical protein